MTLAEQIDKLGATALEIKAQRDRYEKALRDIADRKRYLSDIPGVGFMLCCSCGQSEEKHGDGCQFMIAQEALRCE